MFVWSADASRSPSAFTRWSIQASPFRLPPPAFTASTTPELEDAPQFAEAWSGFREFLGDKVVVGHTIDYDLAVLANEAKRAKLEFKPPRAIDVRILAELVKRDLAGFSIEELAAWLGVKVEHRHSALGDAVTTARIFAALVPHLRERGIRTFAEAEAACREFYEAVGRPGMSGRAAESDPEGAALPPRTRTPTATAFATSCRRRHSLLDPTQP